jgi:hypothetical protein
LKARTAELEKQLHGRRSGNLEFKVGDKGESDPQNEYRELLLYEDGYWFGVHQIIGFASSTDFLHCGDLGVGTAREMRFSAN